MPKMVLAIDPSLRGTGYALLEGNDAKVRCLEYGVINNHPKLTAPACLVAIHEKLTTLIETYHPEAMALENIIYVQSYTTAIALGSARGVALLTAARAGLTIHEYTPKRVKQAVVGRGAAAKTQVSFMVRALLGLTETPPNDAADAIAVGLTHLRNRVVLVPSSTPLLAMHLKKKGNVSAAWKKIISLQADSQAKG
ncbi:MAG: crossover junction endodeoxyribonuclease RuvC [Verrucomicrobia bacterium RIFCSPHIGHO2_12_FULL_41_10]|nr:MAG: crossover junction endodeoxyribonuclease RuvC [Verrucomicrobia bacterium RIFCSPHIGHO2_12_FULL_41_10]HLB33462.1 crossover junction endodeoxyribonuclease RuvC [Chthoniobacterales bacterium]